MSSQDASARIACSRGGGANGGGGEGTVEIGRDVEVRALRLLRHAVMLAVVAGDAGGGRGGSTGDENEVRRRKQAVSMVVAGRELVAQGVCNWIDASLSTLEQNV